MSSTLFSNPYFYSDEFRSLETAEFPVRHHFHVSKPAADRKLVEAMGKHVRLYAAMVALTVLAGAAVLTTAAFVAVEQQAAQQARV